MLNPGVFDPPFGSQGLLVEEPLEVVKLPFGGLIIRIGVPSSPRKLDKSQVMTPTGQPVLGVQVNSFLSALWAQTRSAVFTFALHATRFPAAIGPRKVNLIGAFTDTPVAPS